MLSLLGTESLSAAHVWVDVASEMGAATTPRASDSLVAFVSALITAVGVVWIDLPRRRS